MKCSLISTLDRSKGLIPDFARALDVVDSVRNLLHIHIDCSTINCHLVAKQRGNLLKRLS